MNSSTEPNTRHWYKAASLPLSEDLSALVQALRQHRFPLHISEENGAQIVWVSRREDAQLFLDILERWRSGELDLAQQKINSVKNSKNLWIKSKHLLVLFPVTIVLLIGCVVGALAVEVPSWFVIGNWFSYFDYFTPGKYRSVWDGVFQVQAWRLITPMFLHHTLVHLVFNALMLWVFGSRIEVVVGKLHFLLMVLIISAASNVGQYLWELNPRFGGMSGVNYGLLGYLWIRQLFAPVAVLAMPKGLVTIMLIWLALGVFGIIDLFIENRIANGAHIVGLLAGTLWGASHGWYLTIRK